jgi:hypothetical protein
MTEKNKLNTLCYLMFSDGKSLTKGAMEVDSPVATGKRKSRKLILSSDEEEENMSPK